MWMVIVVASAFAAGILASLVLPVTVFAALLASASVGALLAAIVVRSLSAQFVVLLGGAVICSQVAYVISIAGYALLVRQKTLGESPAPQGEPGRFVSRGDQGRPEV